MASDKFTRPASAVFHVITVVWGAKYLDLFLNWSIPTQLGDGNIAALPAGSRYRVLTRERHVEEVRNHPMMQAIARLMPVDVVGVAALEGVDNPDPNRRGDPRFELMTICHRQSISDAYEAGAALIFLSPDLLMSAGTFASVVRLHAAGIRGVACTGVKIDTPSFVKALDGVRPDGAPPPRQLVRMALPHLHEYAQSMLIDARSFNAFPIGVYWPVGAGGLLVRCLHLHPLMIDPMRMDVFPKGTIDTDFLTRACPDTSRIHVVTDSDEFVIFEISDEDPTGRRCDTIQDKKNRKALVDVGAVRSTGAGVALWCAAAEAARCDDIQIHHWRNKPVCLHSDDLDEQWVVVGAEADAFVRAVMRRCYPFGRRAPRWFRLLEQTRRFQQQYRRAWRQRVPRVRVKQLLRPLRIASSRAGKTLRKSTRQFLRRVGVY